MKPLLRSSIPEYKALSKAQRRFVREEARQGEPNYKWGIWGGFGGLCVRLDKLLMSGDLFDKPGIIFLTILVICIALSTYWDLYIINPKIQNLAKQRKPNQGMDPTESGS